MLLFRMAEDTSIKYQDTGIKYQDTSIKTKDKYDNPDMVGYCFINQIMKFG
jgi:hypothetical protein